MLHNYMYNTIPNSHVYKEYIYPNESTFSINPYNSVPAEYFGLLTTTSVMINNAVID